MPHGVPTTPAVRERLLDEPQLFLKTQREHAVDPPSPAMVELGRDLEVVVAIARRASRRLSGATVELDMPQCAETHRKIDRALDELGRLAAKIPHQPISHHKERRMLSQSQRAAILELNTQKVSKREIARVLKISRLTVREVLQSGSTEVPAFARAEKCDPYRQQILELLPSCKGNLVRVQEELAASGANLSYSALTAFCRRHGIGQAPIVAAGRYHFSPGEEMQHDTSPHEVQLGGKRRKAQTASAVLCYSHMLFFQLYPTFQRFDCKVFLVEALRYFNGVAKRVEIDNTHVVVLRGTGRAMVPVPRWRLLPSVSASASRLMSWATPTVRPG
jgi:hypothetical protein